MVQYANATYTVREYEDGDEAGVLDLMRAALGEPEALPRTRRLWRWKHFENPFGASVVKLAVTRGGRVIGLRAFMRWQFRQGGHLINAVRPVDTATHPDFQRQGIFSRLTTDALETVGADGTGLIYNTPNAQSGPGYLKLGWSQVGNIRPLIRVLNVPRFAWGFGMSKAGRTGRRRHADADFYAQLPPLVSSLLTDDRLPYLIRQDAQVWGDLLHTPRSVPFLQWRYANHPTMTYRTITLEEAGSLVGCLIFRSKTRYGLRELGITEVMVARPDERIVKELVRRFAAAAGADHAVAYVPQGVFHRGALRQSGFRSIPGKGLTLVAKPTFGELADLTELDQWGLSLGDIEFF